MTTPPDFSPLTGSLVDFCKGLEAKLNANIALLAYGGKPARVWYGEQDKYPTTPSYCVEPVRKVRDTENIKLQRVYTIFFTAQVIGYLSKITQGEEVVREEVDRLGEVAEAILNSDHKLGGLTMDLVVSSVESGYAYKQDSKYKAVILTVEGRSQEGLPC
jgi:hypothetical protein